MEKETKKTTKNITTGLKDIYLGAVRKDGYVCDVRVYLINTSNKEKRVYSMLGSFYGNGDDDICHDLGHSRYKKVKIPVKGFVEIDHMRDWGELDFTTWYRVRVGNNEYLDQINMWTFFRKDLFNIPIVNQRGYLGGLGKIGK